MENSAYENSGYVISEEDFELELYEDSSETSEETEGYWRSSWERFKKNKIALISMSVLAAIVIMCIIGPAISPHDYADTNLDIKNQSPSSDHWFGTDQMGRDIFSRVWLGGRISILLGVVGAVVDMVIGVAVGGASGYFGGKIDSLVMRIIEIISGVPYLVAVVLVSLVVGKGLASLIIAMTLAGWCHTARLVRGQVLQIKEQDYILAAKTLGTSPVNIIRKHILPNTVGIIIVSLTFDIPTFIFGEAFLSYIGLGIQSPMTSWGLLASSAQQNMVFYPYQLFFPTLMISLTMLTLQLLGDGARDALDPKSEDI